MASNGVLVSLRRAAIQLRPSAYSTPIFRGSSAATRTILPGRTAASIQQRNSQIQKFSTSTPSRHGHIDPPKPGEEIKVTFIEKDGHESTYEVGEGDNLLDIAQANDLDMEGMCSISSLIRMVLTSLRCMRRVLCLFHLPHHRGWPRDV